MTGLLYNLDDLSEPIGVSQATDTTYTSGIAGLVVSNFDPDRSGNGDATFDGYVASPSVIPELEVSRLKGDDYEVSFPRAWPFGSLRLEYSFDLEEGGWEVLETSAGVLDPVNSLSSRGSFLTIGWMFFRLVHTPLSLE